MRIEDLEEADNQFNDSLFDEFSDSPVAAGPTTDGGIGNTLGLNSSSMLQAHSKRFLGHNANYTVQFLNLFAHCLLYGYKVYYAILSVKTTD